MAGYHRSRTGIRFSRDRARQQKSMIVVSDTSPLRYLSEIGGLEWLAQLFGQVVCPVEVLTECRHSSAPDRLRSWAQSPPPWLRVISTPRNPVDIPESRQLDAGEAAAICLAIDLEADLLLIDERRGRSVASEYGLPITGTLGILLEASVCGLVDFETALATLIQNTNFRVGENVLTTARGRLSDQK